jgi:hypothetical protein
MATTYRHSVQTKSRPKAASQFNKLMIVDQAAIMLASPW